MKKYSILLAAAAIIAAASCAKEALAPEENAAGEKEQTVTEQTLTNPVTITFTANATQTKVSLEGEGTAGSKTAVWDDGDQVKIIWYNTVESTMKSKNATVDSLLREFPQQRTGSHLFCWRRLVCGKDHKRRQGIRLPPHLHCHQIHP